MVSIVDRYRSNLAPLREFVVAATHVLAAEPPEAEALATVGPALRHLVGRDDWLPEELARPHPDHYCQYLLHADPLGRFSVVSFVWGPGQHTPIHDHTVWGLIGMLRGRERAQAYLVDGRGRPQAHGAAATLQPGDVTAVSPTLGDLHAVGNAAADGGSISIHVYGADIGAVQRWVYPLDGPRKPFVSGYANAWVPNLWGAARPAASGA